LISTAGSTPADTLAYDISITVSTQFGQVAMAQMAVPTPRRLVPVGRRDAVSADWGYDDDIDYQIVDQFGRVLPRLVSINEQWTSAVFNDFNGNNWGRNTARGVPSVDPDRWSDNITGPGLSNTPPPNPLPIGPQTPPGNVKIHHWDQLWRVG